jgi:hypothetical protein
MSDQEKSGPTGPSTETLKRLFAKSGDQCAFPKCVSPIVDGIKVVGKVCHIKARNKRGSRYDPDQIDAERHAYENLILLCGRHHDVIDDDDDTYTVDRLQTMKSRHEATATALSEQQVAQGVQLLLNQSVSSTSQSGGITAQTVNIHFNGSSTAPGASQPAARSANDLTPNLIFIGADIAPISPISTEIWSREMGRFERRWATENGQLAILARFTNEARQGPHNAGGLVKALMVYRSQGQEFRRLAGCWLEAPTDFVEFRVDETRELLIAVILDHRAHTVGKRRIPVGFNSETIETKAEAMPHLAEGIVSVRLTNADTGEFLFQREFGFTVNPLTLV